MIAHVVIPFISGAIFLTETETVRHAFQVLAKRFTKEELQRTTLVIILYNKCYLIENQNDSHGDNLNVLYRALKVSPNSPFHIS